MAQSKRKFITVDKHGKLGFERLAGAQSQKSRVLTISSHTRCHACLANLLI